jgi:hypothetical protein
MEAHTACDHFMKVPPLHLMPGKKYYCGESWVAGYLISRGQRDLPWENVGFGSLADITAPSRHVRFTPNHGRWAAHPSQHLAVGL